MMGIHEFTAVINPPQGCILAVSAGQSRLVPGKDGGPPVQTEEMVVTLSGDRAQVDEKTAAAFIQAVAVYLEEPAMMMV
jgi:pyruvate dehydrogenase E2 component (dihydrolipoamide acetyltransferase)